MYASLRKEGGKKEGGKKEREERLFISFINGNHFDARGHIGDPPTEKH